MSAFGSVISTCFFEVLRKFDKTATDSGHNVEGLECHGALFPLVKTLTVLLYQAYQAYQANNCAAIQQNYLSPKRQNSSWKAWRLGRQKMARCFLNRVAKMPWTIWWTVNVLGRTVCSQDSVLLASKTRKCIRCHVVRIHNAGAALQHYALFNQYHDQCWRSSRKNRDDPNADESSHKWLWIKKRKTTRETQETTNILLSE